MPHEPADLRELQQEHPPAPARRRDGGPRVPPGEAAEHSAVRNYVRDLILGFNDGLVSVYAIVAGVAGAAFVTKDIAIAGLAAAIAGALSMGLGEYLSTKSQTEYYAAEAHREREHIRKYPKLEREEVREMLEEKDYPAELIEPIANHITSNENRFVEFMMREEFGVGQESERSPLVAMGLVMIAFIIGAAFPIMPYFLGFGGVSGLAIASALSLTGLFLAGAVKARMSHLNMAKSGFEMLVLGAIAAAITYGVGRLVGVAA